MSKKVERSDEAEQSPEQRAPEEILAAPEPIEFPTELVEEILSDLEGTADIAAPGNTVPFPQPVAPLPDEPEQPAPEPPQDAADEPLAEEAAPDETDEAAAEDEGGEAEAASAEDEEASPDEQGEELPPISETALTVKDDLSPNLDGLSFVERARVRAKIRRREQTRQRRENARRGISGDEAVYQPMTTADIRFTLIRLAIAAVFLVLGMVLPIAGVSLAMYVVAYLITVLPVAARVVRGFTHGKYFNEYLLIFIASLGAFLLGRRPEASIVLILHSVGKLISDMVLHSTHGALREQTDFVPERASIVNMQGEEKHVQPVEINVGDFIMVRSGERIPIDGVILRGEGTVDDTVLTGDSEPKAVEKGAKVLAGSLYTGTLMLIRATAKFEDCAVSQILRMREESAGRRASLENSVIHGASRYMPIIIVLAVLLSLLPPLFRIGDTATWIYRALTVLVICCPTALLLSVPMSFVGGNGRLAQKGIQVKGNDAIEKLAELRMVVFGKTGTLTEGKLHVKEIQATPDFNAESCLALAATAEQLSDHPVARAIVAAYQGIPQKISEFEEFPGRGVRARIGNHNLLVGNRKLMISRGVKGVPDLAGTVVYVSYEGDYAGAIVLQDTVRSEASEAVSGLKSLGVLRTVILTGDTELPAQQAADTIGIDTVHAGLLPEEKASKLEFLLRTIPTDGTAAYVGDGVNDASELGQADIGVEMGAAGSPESAGAANVLIMTNDLTRLTDAVRISRRTHGVALQNMVLLLGVKVVLLLLTMFGVTMMWQAVAADVLLTVLTVLNASRTLSIK
ncbi:heavy metal translocating P-type ATPase [Agathobaculum sp. NTUH-O15-33]|uniref:heavy metal translocating P-type ATPase n=1 Tax=Agathobaculum sp. NTUH-O15-33 TaxID=3079302 RepID=UPI002958DC5C|nr:heavy metal translocating P-type ATPase [Agathobaculum sp. NTUH-O15-33]WNX86571.1 heavy metal translocating P-type ATPase [Agathobaculum sp. NTUH-O15-33]